MAYSFSSIVRYSECDERSLLTIPALVNYLQDCSCFQSEHLGHGVEYLARHHFAWFIAAWNIEINRMPRFLDKIVTSTWCYGVSATNASRNFTICTPEGETLVRANSLWLVFDTNRLRPIRVPQGEDVYLTGEEPLDMPPVRRKIRLSGEGLAQEHIKVTEQHLDTNHHMNNGQYVALADQVIRAHDDAFSASTIQVQYKRMALLGDTIAPRLHVTKHGYTVDLADPQGNSFSIVSMTGSGDEPQG